MNQFRLIDTKLKHLGIGTLVGISSIACTPREQAKPNIIYIMSDDHTTQAIGIYGSRLAALNPTPNIDKIASEGIVFDNAFCNNAICTPSRASIITGQYPQTNGVLDLDGNVLPEKQYLPMDRITSYNVCYTKLLRSRSSRCASCCCCARPAISSPRTSSHTASTATW